MNGGGCTPRLRTQPGREVRSSLCSACARCGAPAVPGGRRGDTGGSVGRAGGVLTAPRTCLGREGSRAVVNPRRTAVLVKLEQANSKLSVRKWLLKCWLRDFSVEAGIRGLPLAWSAVKCFVQPYSKANQMAWWGTEV